MPTTNPTSPAALTGPPAQRDLFYQAVTVATVVLLLCSAAIF